MPLKALVFDVFGTVVDWRGSVSREMAAFGREKGLERDWNAFALSWRAKYQPAMARVRAGERDFVKLDVLHRETDTFAAAVVNARDVPAVLPGQHHVVEIGLPFLLFAQVTVTQAGEPLCGPAIVAIRVRADLGNYGLLRLDREQAGGRVFRTRMWPDRGTDDRHHLATLVAQ